MFHMFYTELYPSNETSRQVASKGTTRQVWNSFTVPDMCNMADFKQQATNEMEVTVVRKLNFTFEKWAQPVAKRSQLERDWKRIASQVVHLLAQHLKSYFLSICTWLSQSAAHHQHHYKIHCACYVFLMPCIIYTSTNSTILPRA